MPTKSGLIPDQKVWLKKCQDSRGSTSVNEETADKFLDTVKKITEERGYLPEQIFMAGESQVGLMGFWVAEPIAKELKRQSLTSRYFLTSGTKHPENQSRKGVLF